MQEEIDIAGGLIYKKGYSNTKAFYLNRARWAVALFYFAMGLCFSSWASRIADIRVTLGLSEADLGGVLFFIPIGQLCIMPFSGKLATKYGSHKTVVIGLSLYLCALTGIGLAQQIWQLCTALFFFGLFSNLTNISVNTQGIHTEELFGRPIMSSFHGMWSTAGFAGAIIGLGMLYLKLSTFAHFAIVAVALAVIIAFNYKYLVKVNNKIVPVKKKLFSKPDTILLWLGAMSFCCMLSEGIMFDWSGIYFKDVVKAEGPLRVLGYASFMVMMATGRFLGDSFIRRFGRRKVLIISGCLISIGLYSAVLLPYLIPATVAFMIVGLGVSSVVPAIYGIAGRNPNVPPGIALQTVSSVSFLGFMVGPPVIGYVAQATSLRISFAIIGIFGLGIAFLVLRIKEIQ